MSLSELKRAVDCLPTDERLELAAHIHQSIPADNAALNENVGLRLRCADPGALEQMALHERLSGNEQ